MVRSTWRDAAPQLLTLRARPLVAILISFLFCFLSVEAFSPLFAGSVPQFMVGGRVSAPVSSRRSLSSGRARPRNQHIKSHCIVSSLAGGEEDHESDEVVEMDSRTEIIPGTVYIVATPIGNLEDITIRALAVLKGVDIIASEDTRRTGRLLKHFGISKPQISHHEHNWRTSAPQLVAMAQEGQAIAVVSDAGTPGVADPGTELVAACVDEGVRVEAVPGACAAVAAISTSGLAREGFTFAGFMPPKGERRRRALEEVLGSGRTVVLYEAPHRRAAASPLRQGGWMRG